MQDNPTIIPIEELLAPHILHTFLIRTPDAIVNSWLKVVLTGENRFASDFCIDELGIRDSRVLYEYISKVQAPTEKPLFVIDSDDLVKDPEGILCAYCEQ